MTKKWFKSVTVLKKSSVLQTFANQRDRDKPLPRYRGPRLIDFDAWTYPRVGSRILYIDRIETMYTTRDFMKILDIDKATVYKWQKMGIIPPPLFLRENKYGKSTKYYVRPQVSVVVKIINDLRRQGLLRLTKNKIEHHLEMVKAGNEIVLKEWHRKRERDVERKRRGKFGVRWTDVDN